MPALPVNISELIYDWNLLYPQSLHPPGPVRLTDETLRDGLQSPSVRDPSIEQKIEILHLMEALGINTLDLGLPGAGPRAVEHVTALAREIVAHKMKITAYCAARTHQNDIRPIAEIVQKTGLPIEVAAFLGTSPIRRYAEGWTSEFLLQTTEKAVKYAVSLGLEVMYVTEDTTRCDPATVKQLNSAAIASARMRWSSATPPDMPLLWARSRWSTSCLNKSSSLPVKKFASTGMGTAIGDWQPPTPWRLWWRARIAFMRPRSAWESASAIPRWTRCWSI